MARGSFILGVSGLWNWKNCRNVCILGILGMRPFPIPHFTHFLSQCPGGFYFTGLWFGQEFMNWVKKFLIGVVYFLIWKILSAPLLMKKEAPLVVKRLFLFPYFFTHFIIIFTLYIFAETWYDWTSHLHWCYFRPTPTLNALVS